MPSRNLTGRIDTSTPYIRDLVAAIGKGEMKVPKFQRPFVWKEEQALRLLDSIAHNYPVGSLLIWRTPDKLASERNIGNFTLPETDDLSPTDYVLDGQQRLTVVYSCFAPLADPDAFSAAYDLRADTFTQLKPDSPPDPLLFPLRFTFDTRNLLDFRAELQNVDDQDGTYQRRLDEVVDAFTSYKFPLITLKDLTLDDVCPIFERINSSGTRLSMYDLMVAATFSAEFDLDDHVTAICDALEPKGFGDVERETVLKCLSAIGIGTIKEPAIRTLREKSDEQLAELVHRTQESLKLAIDLLSTSFRIHSWDFLAYEALLVIIAYIYSIQTKLRPDQVQRLVQWFWRASFGERYKVGGENFVTRDLEIVREWVINGVGKAHDFGSPMDAAAFASVPFRSNNSRSRAFILLLASAGPRDLLSGATVDVSEALSGFNKKQYHHLFPKQWLKERSSADANCLANICMTSAASNNWIRARDPHAYIPTAFGAHGGDAEGVFRSNFLPVHSEETEGFDYSRIGFPEFTFVRGAYLEQQCKQLCGG